ncbi:MAG TPA: excinuclease ABC subunit UvrA, partial [Pseudodesulfovibrio sp.]|nr:excinuclease ABC subunit UvrA [Pseudodesulfovibrio sp.]
DLIAPNKGLSLDEGGIIPWKNATRQRQYGGQLKKLGNQHGFTMKTPLTDFSDKAWEALFYGDRTTGWPGVVPILEYGREQAGVWDHWTARFQQSKPCPVCEGARLKPESLAVRVADKNMVEFTSMSIQRALEWLEGLEFSGHDTLISEPLLKELTHRLGFMVNVGLEYLSLGRNMATLSGGEAQRIRLASQLGSGLVGVTYVLDEPSIGLHPRDNQRLLDTLRSLQSRGNTVLVVEHDEPTIREADHVIEIGPSSGWLGGEIVFQGKVDDLLKADSLTGKYLRGDLFIAPPETRRKPTGHITLKKVQTNNLKDLDVDIPLGVMTCVTGVSGSGKSSLVMDSLYKHLLLNQGQKANDPGKIGGIHGIDKIEKVISIDQSPIGRTPRSNPATYTKIFDEIRKIFAGAKESRTRGYQPGRFSFNVKGGRCEACKGDGQIRVEMHFLPDVYVTCETCKGKRYNAQTLEVEYRGKNIADVLNMTVRQAREFFANHPALMRKLDVLSDVGLDYVRLGQPATTLSGGEAQRIKISRELGKRSLPGALYILDEPTTGLHMHEVGKLIRVLHKLVDKNATVIVIEHNTDVIMGSDHVIDLGPGGGEHGGQIVASGTPEEIIANPESVTGKFLV